MDRIRALGLLVLLCSGVSHAYTFTDDFQKGFYWESFPFRVTAFAVSDSEGSLLASLTDAAQKSWEDSVGRNIWDYDGSYVLSNDFFGSYIRWSDNFAAETGFDPSQTLAVTIRYSSGTHVNRTEIILNGSLSYLRNNSGGALATTILHELGHTIGLDHSDQAAVMSTHLGGISTLQNDDVQGANAVLDEALSRQANGFVSSFATEEDGGGACGSIAFINPKDPPGGNKFPTTFAFSLLMGFLLTLVPVRKILPSRQPA